MLLNILVRGQSNAALLYTNGFAALLVAEVERLLGFDGVANKVVLLGGPGVSAFAGTALLPGPLASPAAPPWLQPAGAGFSDGAEQQTLDAYLAALPAAEKSAPTAIVWLHNEYDSFNTALTPSAWASAVAFAIGEDRAALGQPAASVPVDFVTVPYDVGHSLLETLFEGGAAQPLKLGMQALVDDATFNAAWGAQIGDSNMDATDPFFGGEHADAADLAQLANRLALTIADQFAQFAQPLSPIATGGPVDGAGPSVAGAQFVAGQPAQVLVQLGLPAGGGGLQALSAAAAAGAGWSIQDGATPLYAASAQALAGDQLLLTFAAPVPTDGSAQLYYGFGSGRLYPLASPLSSTSYAQPAGQGAAVYDGSGLPLTAPAAGVAVQTPTAAAAAFPAVQGDPASATLAGTPANAIVTLGEGSFTVTGGQGAMEVDGGGGAATVFSGNGNATVRGGLGRDVVWGGSGALLAAGGLAGHDLLGAGAGSAVLMGTEDDTLIGGAGTTLAVLGGGASLFVGGGGPATVFAAKASAASATVLGGSGAATVLAGNGRLSVVGGTGALSVLADPAAAAGPTIAAANGNLTLWGGGGGPAELVVAAGHAGGSYVLAGFREGIDHIALQGFAPTEAAAAVAGATAVGSAGVAMSLSDGTHLVLLGITPAQLDRSVFF